jgi:hypothetical protein
MLKSYARRRIFGLVSLSFSLIATTALAGQADQPPAPKPSVAKPPSPKAQEAAAREAALKAAIEKVDSGMVDDQAIAIIRAAAEAGSGPAAQRLGYMYISGVGMEMNYPQAYLWYCIASLRNVPFAIDTAFKAFNRMTPAARVFAENLVSTKLTPSEIARLIAMRPPNIPSSTSNPGSDGGSTSGDSTAK